MEFYSLEKNPEGGKLTFLEFRDEIQLVVVSPMDTVISALRGGAQEIPIDEGALANVLYVASERLLSLIDYMIQQGGFKGCKCG